MKAFLEKLEYNFYNELQTILDTGTKENNLRPALELSRKYLVDLKNEIMSRGFQNHQDEITCFKLTKPKLQAELIYYRGILIAQQDFPLGSDEKKIGYLNEYLNRFHLFFEENREFIRYSRSESTDLDHQFFIRENAMAMHKDYEVDFSAVDFSWNTGYDLVLAKSIAFEKLENRIKIELFRITNSDQVLLDLNSVSNNSKKVLKWTDSKTSLVELIYALHSVGVLNNGQIDLKTITEVLADVFQVELGDHYRTYHDLKSRKIDRTKFLNNLIETLTRRMESDDE
ncbi:RteC domain-containing protein [Fluviicola sp.]|uniref:RteC domain-containing protein n=1 Tax=Fluviicola sp. TaxID=1917219 RepID=UPI0031D8D7DF